MMKRDLSIAEPEPIESPAPRKPREYGTIRQSLTTPDRRKHTKNKVEEKKVKLGLTQKKKNLSF